MTHNFSGVWWLRRLKQFFLKSILFSCDIHFILKSYPFYFHVISILFSCHTHFIFMSYSFYFHVIVILKQFLKIFKNFFKKFKKNFKIKKLFHIDLKKNEHDISHGSWGSHKIISYWLENRIHMTSIKFFSTWAFWTTSISFHFKMHMTWTWFKRLRQLLVFSTRNVGLLKYSKT